MVICSSGNTLLQNVYINKLKGLIKMCKFVVRVKGQIVKRSDVVRCVIDTYPTEHNLINPVECESKKEATELVNLLKDYDGLAAYTSCEKECEVCVQYNSKGVATGYTLDDVLFISPDYITINDKKVYAY